MDTINALPSSASPLYFSEYHGVVWQDTHTNTHIHTQGQCWSSPAPLLNLLLFSLPIPELSLQYDKSTLLCIFHRSDTEHESGKTSETIIAADSLNWASSFLTWRVWGVCQDMWRNVSMRQNNNSFSRCWNTLLPSQRIWEVSIAYDARWKQSNPTVD